MDLSEFKDLCEKDADFKDFINDMISLGQKYVKITGFIGSDFSKDKYEINGLNIIDIHKIFVNSENDIKVLINGEAGKIIKNYLQKKEEN